MSEANDPLVSVCCITYNHGLYISQAIEGFLMQKTNFPFEIVIGEDKSQDDTRNICIQYAARYPDRIRLLHREHNLGMLPNFFDTLKSCHGKFIALCEGDDYWTDPYKLQKQVDFLEANPDCSLCFHATEYIFNDTQQSFIYRPGRIPKDSKFDMKHAILAGGGMMATNSMMFPREYTLERPKWVDKAPVGDLPLMLLLASKGRIGYLDEVMGVYRVHAANAWSSTMSDSKKRSQHYRGILKMWDEFDEWSHKNYHNEVVRKKLKNRWNYFKGKLRTAL